MEESAQNLGCSALGLVAVLVVGLCTLLSYVAVERRRKKLGLGQAS